MLGLKSVPPCPPTIFLYTEQPPEISLVIGLLVVVFFWPEVACLAVAHTASVFSFN